MIHSHTLSYFSIRLSQLVEEWWFARAGASAVSNFAQLDRKNSIRYSCAAYRCTRTRFFVRLCPCKNHLLCALVSECTIVK